MKSKVNLRDQIDQDESLRRKGKWLVVVSLISLALSFSGATIEEVNTLIFKLKLENQSWIGTLMILAIVFLMVRYYSYAVFYHNQLYDLWSERLIWHPKICLVPNNRQPCGGFIKDYVNEAICKRESFKETLI